VDEGLAASGAVAFQLLAVTLRDCVPGPQLGSHPDQPDTDQLAT
jgi:hypothetical protein